MPKGWRFRTTWWGTVVLQKRWSVYDMNLSPERFEWRDARSEDLVEFLEANKC